MKRHILFGTLLVGLGACSHGSTLPAARALSPDSANVVGVGYSPDGSQIYWWAREGDRWQLWKSPADMSAPQKVPLLSRGPNPVVWSPDGSQFAVGAGVNTVLPAVWVVPAAGGAPRQVTPGESFGYPADWNPDGKRIAYQGVVGGSVVAMMVDVDSGAPVRLVPSERLPHVAFWSPDGSRLAVNVLEPGGRSTIWLADSLGGHLRQLTTEGFENLADRPWSPDGKSLLYVSNRTGTNDIWLVPVDSGAPLQLTRDVRDDQDPTWSPDGKWIAFFSNRGLQSDLWVKPAAGGPARRVTDDAMRETLIGWRPGTEQLAYTSGRTSQTIRAYSVSDGTERQLTPDSLQASFFNLSAKGRVMVGIARGGGVFDFGVMPLGGGAPRIILPDAQGQTAWWSPDGSKLAFASNRGGSQDIWTVDTAGGAPRRLTSWPGSETDPKWSADGSEIYFRADHEATFPDVWRIPAAGGTPTRVTHSHGVLGLCGVAVVRPDALFGVVLGEGGGRVLQTARVRSDGTLQSLWQEGTAVCGPISPTADSLVLQVAQAGGGLGSRLVSFEGGAGRPLLKPEENPQAWSPDGRQLLYSFRAEGFSHLAILSVADGTTRQITNARGNDGGAEWSADDSTIVFQRSVPVNRIYTADLTQLLAGPAPGEPRR
jgi:Tol biopolymer transport system component